MGRIGDRVASAGDVNGDGYSDVLFGAIIYENIIPTQEDEGWAFLFYGNEGKGFSLVPGQRRSDNSVHVDLLCKSDAIDQFRLAAQGKTPYGRAKVKLELEVKQLGTPFDGTGTQQGASWADTLLDGAPLNELVSGLWGNVPYHWRACVLYHPGSVPFQQYSRWFSRTANGWEETDLRTAPFVVTARTPGANDLNVGASASIVVTFDNIIDGTTVTSDTFNVDGSISGHHTSSFTGGGTDTITCSPSNGFVPGEVVTVTLTRGIKNPGGGILANPVSWDFTIQATAGFANFPFASSFGTGTDNTYSVAFADVDADGDLDIAAGNLNGQNTVYLNDGTGSFTGGTKNFGTGTDQTSCIAFGDVDGDGDIDVAVGNNTEKNAVYLNDGAGNFTAGIRNFGTGTDKTSCIAFGDIDGDGDLDIAVGNDTEQNAVYLNDGAGNFIAGIRNFGTGTDKTTSVAFGDADGDGHPDIAAGNNTEQNVVYLNDAYGNLTKGTVYFGTGIDNTYSVAFGDADGDGDPDIALGNTGQQNVVCLNDGAGNFTGTVNFGTGTDPTMSVAFGDADNDGSLDIALGNQGGQNTICLNDGAGDFTGTINFGTGTDSTLSVAFGDTDSDGDMDIATGNPGEQNAVYLNKTPFCPSTNILYVDTAAGGLNNGDDWSNALTNFQDALTEARSGGCISPVITEIHVAQGDYKPGTGRADTFQLINGITIYGGFPTGGGVRDWAANITTLSGDIGVIGNDSDNSFHVVTGNGTDNTAVLDGFTITKGNANDTAAPDDKGGGMYSTGSPVITNCVFSSNKSGREGAGLYNTGNPSISNCKFNDNATSNFADGYGGGIYNEGSPVIDNCTFTNNFAKRNGGGTASFTGNPVITNCLFTNNTGDNVGGGIHNGSGLLTLSGCIFTGNSANQEGGAMFVGGTLAISHCTITGNSGAQNGGGITFSGNGTITHSTIVSNTADSDSNGSGIGGGIRVGGSLTIKNCIVANNKKGILPPTDDDISNAGTISSDYNIVEFFAGYTPGANDQPAVPGNITNLNLGPLQDNGGLTQTMALLDGSAAIDTGDPLFTTPPDFDQRGTGFSRLINCVVDIGAYEVQTLPETETLDSVTDIPDNTGIVSFGTTTMGTPVIKTFTVKSTGARPLLLSSLAVPAGFSIAGTFGSTSITAGGSTTFQIQMDAAAGGSPSGTLQFNTNDHCDENPFNFTIQGTVLPVVEFSQPGYQVNEDGTVVGVAVTITGSFKMPDI